MNLIFLQKTSSSILFAFMPSFFFFIFDCYCLLSAVQVLFRLWLLQDTDTDVASSCFEELPSTDISLQVAIFYYALRIYSCVAANSGTWSCGHHANPLYRQAPSKVVGRVKDYLASIKGKEEAESKIEARLVDKFQQYQEMLEDYNQACVLQDLGKGEAWLSFCFFTWCDA